MRRVVEAAGGEVEADGGGFAAWPKMRLTIDRIIALQNGVIRLAARGADGLDQRHQLRAQGGEQLRHVGRRRARFVLVEQGVIGRVLVADGLRLLALEADDLVEPWLKRGEVIGRAACCQTC